jgi:hypothetical protein
MKTSEKLEQLREQTMKVAVELASMAAENHAGLEDMFTPLGAEALALAGKIEKERKFYVGQGW